jgi:parvulin-like peptidyl-prolyl isomerase
MTTLLKVGDRTIHSYEIVPLLKQYGLLPKVVREIIIDNALTNFELTQEETMQAYKQFYQEHKLNAEADLQAWLESRGFERQHLNYLATRNIKLERFKKSTWIDKLDSYFIQRKSKLDRVIYSLIRVDDIGIAQELYFRIQEGEQSFSELAREFSQGSEAQTGGMLGPVELGTPHPILANILSSSQPGQLVPPTRLGEWIIIVRLEKFLPAMLDEPTQQRLINELFEIWLQNQVKEYLKKDFLASSLHQFSYS